MQLPVHDPNRPQTRPLDDVRAMAVVVQANLVQLRTFDAKRRGLGGGAHELEVRSPGAVRRFREALIALNVLKGYEPVDLALRTREMWGRYCLFAWALHATPPRDLVSLAALPADNELRCDAHLSVKRDEIHAVLWRLRFEQRMRADRTYADAPEWRSDRAWAARIPATVAGAPVNQCADDELLLAACEHAGMLAAIRWILDRSADWGDARLMLAEDVPFPGAEERMP